MFNPNHFRGMRDAAPENGEGCEPASSAPFKTGGNKQQDFAAIECAQQAGVSGKSWGLTPVDLINQQPSLLAFGNSLHQFGGTS